MSKHATAAHDLRATIESLGPWFHNIHLPDGTQTAPGHRFGDFPAFKWRKLAAAVPADLHGWSVLDIGCNAGFYSLELARRGANVLGVDVEPLYLRQARWVAQHCGLQDRLQFMHADVYDLIWQRRKFDLVWFTGVFYHLRYPLLALDLVRAVTGRLMMFQTMTMPDEATVRVPHDLPLEAREQMLQAGWPKMAFIEHSVAGDATNWWAPNHAGVEALLRAAGFEVLSRPEHEFYLCGITEQAPPADLKRLLHTIES
ncbi:MAG TPA: TIGR04290 family methyltransferase [Steroidobacteraceae bacterium]|nr:TIGR04290 family methyltransferase [Steroidobacteraceae bacterium]